MSKTATKKKKAKKTVITVTYAQFDSGYKPDGLNALDFSIERNGIPIGDFPTLTLADFSPRGGTPLRDATAAMIAHMGTVHDAAPDGTHIGILVDRSGSMGGKEQSTVNAVNEFVGGMSGEEAGEDARGKVLILIVTDGGENSSKEVDASTLKAMIDVREERGWSFIYMGANQDSVVEAQAAGLANATIVNYNDSTPHGSANALRTVSARGQSFLTDNKSYMASASAVSGATVDADGAMFVDDVEIDPVTGKPKEA